MPSPYRALESRTFERGAVTVTAAEILVDGSRHPRQGLVRAAVARRRLRRLRIALLLGLVSALASALLGAGWLGLSIAGIGGLTAATYLLLTKRHGLILTWASGQRLAIYCSSVDEAKRIRDALEITSALVAVPNPSLSPMSAPEPDLPALGSVTGVQGGEVELIQEQFARIDARTEQAGIEERLDAKAERAYLANAIRQAEDNRRRGR